jgi:putative DNA primase/helicase
MIRKWWRWWPEANIGLVTGAVSGFIVVDVDPEKRGDASLADLQARHGPLPETIESLTGGGGLHKLYGHPGVPVANSVAKIAPGIDIRGDNGYVIAPPSLHLSGRPYAWDVTRHPDDTPLAPCPAWLLRLMQTSTPVPSVAGEDGAPITEGRRNDTLFRLGSGMRARSVSAPAILAALKAINAEQCTPPLSDKDVERIAVSCARYETGSAASSTAPHGEAHGAAHAQSQDARDVLPYSDYTNAIAFVRDHGQDLRYCYPWKEWLLWTGTHWERDMSGEVPRRAKQTVRRLATRLATIEEGRERALLAHIKSSLSTTKLKALVENAQSEPGIPVMPEALDTYPWLLNCANGILDLTTGTLRPHERKALLSKCVPVDYDPHVTCPTWDAFLWRIMGGTITPDDPDMSVGELAQRQAADTRAKALIDFLQRMVGYSLTGATHEQCLFILHGPTKTGKSTFLALLRALLGPYGQQADMSSFMHKERDEVRNDLADLAGSRVVCAIETQEGRRLAEALIKQVTGGVDLIKARFLFKEYFTYKPQFKLFLGTNHKPIIHDTDSAIWERIRLVPFVVHIPKPDRDTTLEGRLKTELPGILAWAVRGCLAWQQQGGLHEPAPVEDATQQYREDMDDLGRFLKEVCILAPAHKVMTTVLLKAYQHWSGHHEETAKSLHTKLSTRGYVDKRGNMGNFWHGIGLPAETTREG